MNSVVLASASPRRKELLEQIGVPFTVITSRVDETIEKPCSPEKVVEELALRKARKVAKSLQKGWVLGADTIVVLKNEILGKPKDTQDAFEMLKKLSNHNHWVITGIALLNAETGSYNLDYEKTKVFFASLQTQEIMAYINTGEPFDKAGAYGIQGKAAVFIQKIEGSYSNVVGLPLRKTAAMLEKAGIRKEVYWLHDET